MKSINEIRKTVRPGRSVIGMSVENYGAEPQKELPFVVGVMGDFSGDATAKLEPLKQREFVRIGVDDFDSVMERMNVGARFTVKNTLAGDGSELPVELRFTSMKDFDPTHVARQVDPLRKLLSTRDRLKDLMLKAENSPELQGLLKDALSDENQLGSLQNEVETRLKERLEQYKSAAAEAEDALQKELARKPRREKDIEELQKRVAELVRLRDDTENRLKSSIAAKA